MKRRRTPIPEVRLLILATLVTSLAYLVGVEVYAPKRVAELAEHVAELESTQPDVFVKVKKAVEDAGGQYPPATPSTILRDLRIVFVKAKKAVEDAGGQYPLAPPSTILRNLWAALDVFRRVGTIEGQVRAYNFALADEGRKDWNPHEKAKSGVARLTINSSEIAMWYGPEQAVALTLVVWAILILYRLSREIRHELRTIDADRRLTRSHSEVISPSAAKVLCDELEEQLKPGLAQGGAYHDRQRVWAYRLMCSKLLRLYASSANLEAVQELQHQEVESAWQSFSRRLSNVEYTVWAAPTLKFLGTLRNMRAGLVVANSPENMSEVIGFMGYSFDATVVALFVLLPLIFATKYFSRRLEGLRLTLKDASDGLVDRLGPEAEVRTECHATDRDQPKAKITIENPPPVTDPPVTEPDPLSVPAGGMLESIPDVGHAQAEVRQGPSGRHDNGDQSEGLVVLQVAIRVPDRDRNNGVPALVRVVHPEEPPQNGRRKWRPSDEFQDIPPAERGGEDREIRRLYSLNRDLLGMLKTLTEALTGIRSGDSR